MAAISVAPERRRKCIVFRRDGGVSFSVMNSRKREGGLTGEEKRIVKALLSTGARNQDIQALVNTGRGATINGARITGVKKDQSIRPARRRRFCSTKGENNHMTGKLALVYMTMSDLSAPARR
jgi:hypothetical protein